MATQEKVTISLPKELVNTLREVIPDRKRSKFSKFRPHYWTQSKKEKTCLNFIQ